MHNDTDTPPALSSLHCPVSLLALAVDWLPVLIFSQDSAARRQLVGGLLRALGWKKKVVVVSASMGGMYGSPFVLLHPEQVQLTPGCRAVCSVAVRAVCSVAVAAVCCVAVATVGSA